MRVEETGVEQGMTRWILGVFQRQSHQLLLTDEMQWVTNDRNEGECRL